MKTIAPELQHLRVMYVEDEGTIRREMARFLKRRVKTLLVAEDGREGLELFRSHQPDLIVTDIRMPSMDGLDMTAAIRASNREVPIIFMTAHNDGEYLMRAIEVGVTKYLMKPADPHALVETLREQAAVLLERRGAWARGRLATLLLDHQPNFVLSIAHGRIEYMNRTLREYLDARDLSNTDHSDFEKMDDAARLESAIHKLDGREYSPGGEIQWHRYIADSDKNEHRVEFAGAEKNGPPVPYIVKTHRLESDDARIFTFTEVTGMERERRKLYGLATVDRLTSVGNRYQLEQAAEQALTAARCTGAPLSIIIFDIDHLKAVNDALSHQAGDRLLKAVSSAVRENIREGDFLARWGGDEFILIAPNADLEAVRTLAEKLRRLLADLDRFQEEPVTVSFGCAAWREDEDWAELFARADSALYAAKKNGRDRVEIERA